MQERATLAGLIRFGPFALNRESRELHKGATRLKVPDQSIEILTALLERPGELVTRDELRQRLWSSDTFVDFDAIWQWPKPTRRPYWMGLPTRPRSRRFPRCAPSHGRHDISPLTGR